MQDYFEQAISAVDRPKVQMVTEGGFWRKDPPVLDLKTRMVKTGGMWVPQREFWDLTNFIRVFVGGYGAGKTMIGCKWISGMALENAPCPVATVSPTFSLARRTIIQTLNELLSGKQRIIGKALWWRYNRSLSEYKIRYHGREATIIIQSGEDPRTLRGPNLAAALLDEPFIMQQEVFDQMIARVRHPQARKKGIALTGTPEQLNWGYDLCKGELKERHDVGVVHGSTRANLALGTDYVNRLEGSYADKAADAYIEGEFVNLGKGMVYYAFGDANVVEKPIPDGADLGAGMDFNVNPMSACVFWRHGTDIHFFDEIELANADTEFMCQELNERYTENPDYKDRPLRIIYPDATGSARKTSAPGGRTDFHYIRSAGFQIAAPHENPKRRDRYNAVNGKLRPKVGPITMTVSKKCKKLIKYLSTYSFELMTRQQEMSHLLDAMGYPVSYLFPVIHNVTGMVRLEGA